MTPQEAKFSKLTTYQPKHSLNLEQKYSISHHLGMIQSLSATWQCSMTGRLEPFKISSSENIQVSSTRVLFLTLFIFFVVLSLFSYNLEHQPFFSKKFSALQNKCGSTNDMGVRQQHYCVGLLINIVVLSVWKFLIYIYIYIYLNLFIYFECFNFQVHITFYKHVFST